MYKMRSLFYILLTITLLSTYCGQISGQEKIHLSGGFGFPDLVNIGTRYQLKQDSMQLGISIGIGQGIQALSADVFNHFGGYSKLSTRRPWYLKGGVNIIHEHHEESSAWALLFNLRSGRDINLTRKAGLNLEAGLGFSPIQGILMEETKIFPSFGIYFFYRTPLNRHYHRT